MRVFKASKRGENLQQNKRKYKLASMCRNIAADKKVKEYAVEVKIKFKLVTHSH